MVSGRTDNPFAKGTEDNTFEQTDATFAKGKSNKWHFTKGTEGKTFEGTYDTFAKGTDDNTFEGTDDIFARGMSKEQKTILLEELVTLLLQKQMPIFLTFTEGTDDTTS